jgi:hypothetical protein
LSRQGIVKSTLFTQIRIGDLISQSANFPVSQLFGETVRGGGVLSGEHLLAWIAERSYLDTD